MQEFTIAIVIIGAIYFSRKIGKLENEIRNLKESGIKPAENVSIKQNSTEQVNHLENLPFEDQLEKLDGNYTEEVVPEMAPDVKKPQELDVEFKLGSKFFTVIGAIAVIAGVGFFVRYAFANDLISETTRIFLGILA